MAELVVKKGGTSRSYDLREGKALFAGRIVECDIYLPSPGVSRRHAVFLAKNGECGVKDLESANGTFLNGKRLSKPVRLRHGDVLQMADFTIEFRATPDKGAGIVAASGSRRLSRDTRNYIRDVAPEAQKQPAAKQKAEVPATTEIVLPAKKPPPVEKTPPPSEPAAADTPAAKQAEPPKIPPMPPTPKIVRPERVTFSDDEVGDGSADASFVIEDEGGADDSGAGDAALTKAAAEAGLVGEFSPDTGEEPAGAGDSHQPAQGGQAAVGMAPPEAMPDLSDHPAFALPLDDALRQAIEARLYLYSFLAELKSERDSIVAARPKLADAVKAELARQDREMDKIPTADQAENMIEKRRAKHDALMQKIEEAKKNGENPPPKPSRDMREAEELAITQWTFISQSLREALPAVYAEAFRLAESEPLAESMRKADLDPVPLMGGSIYYFALERLLEEAKFTRQDYRAKLASIPDPNEKKSGGGMMSMFGRGKKDEDEEEADQAALPGESYEELVAGEKLMADRAGWINQELAYLEKALIQEFWRVYTDLALFYLPDHERMPLAARAFLRHGAIGFETWWMKPEVRDHLLQDCREEIVHHMEVGKNITNILYADEYLAAVMNLECTPALDENLEINERNSPNWKADKALRKLINSRSQRTLLEELIGSLGERIDDLEAEAAKVDQQMEKLLPGSKNIKAVKSELGQKRQAFKVEISKIGKLATKIREETLANLNESIAETEERFTSGELPKPGPEFLIRRECDAVHKIGRLLANLKERFMPLVLRDNFQVNTDAVNDRLSINGEIMEMERRDPGLFLENLVPSKKKASRVDLRISPTIVLLPSAGVLAYSWNPRGKPEDGRLAIPTCFIRRRIRERQITYLLADFRWDTSKAAAGMDIMTSETIVAAFMTVRWDWRKRSKEGREKGLIYTEQNDRTNWRRVYEAYSQTAYDSGKKLFNRNYDFYERIIGKYFDLPDGVPLLKK